MGQNPSAPPVSFDDGFTVGEWRINSRQASLSRGTETRHIEYKVMATLLLLARRPSQVVTRAEFLDEVWQGRVVNEEALSRAISLLRTALDDDVHEPRYIQTIPRTGYRLIAEVCALEPMNETQPRREWRFPRDSLAVLPFASLDGDGNEYIGAGLTEELSTALAKVPGLRVVSTTLARGLSPEELRQRLRVRAFTEGTVRQRGDTLRVTVRLIDADSGVQSWSEVYERSMRDIYELQNEIADAIVANLSDSLGIAPRIEPARTDTDAYRNFLLGRYHIERRGADNIRRGIERLEHAVAADPGFVRAHLLLANAYALLPSYAPVDERALLARAETILDQVRTLTGSEAATHRLRGFVRLRRGEWIAAEQAFRRAQVHTPDDVEMLQWHSVLLAAVGYLESALEQAQRAVATEPLSPIANLRLASVHTWLGDMEQADRCAKLALELGIDPLAGIEPRLLLMIRRRQFAALEQQVQQAQQYRGHSVAWIGPWIAALREPDTAGVARANTLMAQACDAGELSPRLRFGASMVLGDPEPTIAAAWELHRTGNYPDAIEGVYAAEGAPVRQHPAFRDLARDTGLAAFWDQYGWPPLGA